jgi:hypothetical protein
MSIRSVHSARAVRIHLAAQASSVPGVTSLCSSQATDIAYATAGQGEYAYQLTTAAYMKRTDTGGSHSLWVALGVSLGAAAAPELAALPTPKQPQPQPPAQTPPQKTSARQRMSERPSACGPVDTSGGFVGLHR